MSIRVSTYDNRKMPAVTREWNGTAGVAQTPDPNSGMANFQRGQTQQQGDTNPLGLNVGLALRGTANRHASDYAHSTSQDHPMGIFNSLNTVLPDSRWEGYKQALFERGVGHLATAASLNRAPDQVVGSAVPVGTQPGFFDVQNGGAQAQQQRAYQQKASDFNLYGRAR